MTNSAGLLNEPDPQDIDDYIQLGDGKWYHKTGAQERGIELAAEAMKKDIAPAERMDRMNHYAAMVEEQVGDVTSSEKGSGARYNAGKPPMAYIPIRQQQIVWAAYTSMTEHMTRVLDRLGLFEEGQCRMVDVINELTIEDLVESSYVWDYGAKKYAAWNWAKGMAWSVPMACISRHVMAILKGEELDPESGCTHWGHVVCNLLMLEHYINYYPEGDDLPPPEVFS
jgi:hypothetical protein